MMKHRPIPRMEIDQPPPAADIKIHVYLNRADHERIQALALQQGIPGARYSTYGAVSALFRHLERVILEDWT